MDCDLEVKMKKIYCDICNREVTDTKEYILPKRETVWAEDKFGNKLMPFGETTKPEYKDVCTRCAGLLNTFIDGYLPALSTADDIYKVQFNLIKMRE